ETKSMRTLRFALSEPIKRFFTTYALHHDITLPAAAQWQQRRLSEDDQRRFDSYYSRWQDYRRTNNREQISSMENRMQDIYRHYRIPADTPYGREFRSDGRYPACGFPCWKSVLDC